jgi:hypothetical protein
MVFISRVRTLGAAFTLLFDQIPTFGPPVKIFLLKAFDRGSAGQDFDLLYQLSTGAAPHTPLTIAPRVGFPSAYQVAPDHPRHHPVHESAWSASLPQVLGLQIKARV